MGDLVDELRAAVAVADVTPLLSAVAHLTGETGLLRPELSPDQTQLLTPARGLTPEQEAEARALALDALLAHIESGRPDHGLAADELPRLFAFMIGAAVTPHWLEFLREELALEGSDARAPSWHREDVMGQEPLRCAVVGAGVSGLAAAHRLRQAGADVTIFEKNADVGGTWLENVYPGCRVDVPNQLYSLSFAQSNDWVSRYSAQPDLLAYLQKVARDFDLLDLIAFSTEVTQATWDDGARQWVVDWRGPDGTVSQHHFAVLVSAVGQLNRPSFPTIAGRERFAGPSFHSAVWDHDVPLGGKRVAVVGSGASAAQFVPEVVDRVAHLDVFQRTPPWLLPTEDYEAPFPPAFHDLLKFLPVYGRWDRVWQFWIMHEALLPAAKVDPQWEGDPHRSVSEANEFVRQLLLDVMRTRVADAELFAKMEPQFPPFAKRALRDDGRWGRALSAPHAELIVTPIAEITETGITTDDGVAHPADVLIFGTGFSASQFVAPMRVVGQGGVELNEEWGGDAKAYLGVTVPGFPNFFMLYGPNTNLVINGSIIVFVECQVHYLVEALGLLLEAGRRSMTVRRSVHESYNDEIEAGNEHMVWGVADVPTWYKNANGRVTQNWPFDLHSYWARTRTPDLTDYELA